MVQKGTVRNLVYGEVICYHAVMTALAAISLGGGRPGLESSSTDANLPMSLGLPAITIGSGFRSERSHSPDERLLTDRETALRYMAMSLATIVTAAGIAK